MEIDVFGETWTIWHRPGNEICMMCDSRADFSFGRKKSPEWWRCFRHLPDNIPDEVKAYCNLLASVA